MNAEAKWREALERKGKDWVSWELRIRTGSPQDCLLDVVYDEPHPTREFCQRWCIEQENRVLRVSLGPAVAMALLFILMFAGIIFGTRSFERVSHAQTAMMAH